MANRLIVRELTSVGLVPEGDNPDAAIVFWKRKFSRDQRDQMASRGQALPDGSFPIATVGDLRNAVQAVGRATNPAAARRHIIKRARALGRTDLLPDSWGVAKTRTGSAEQESHMDFLDKIEDDELRTEVEKALDERDAEIAELRKDDEPDPADVLKDADDATVAAFEKQQAELDELRKAAEATAEELAKERETRLQADYLAKAKAHPTLGKPDEVGPMLRKIADADAFDWFIAKIEQYEALIDGSELLKELGVDDAGSAAEQIEALAKEKQTDNPDLSIQQARALVRTEHPELKQQEREGV